MTVIIESVQGVNLKIYWDETKKTFFFDVTTDFGELVGWCFAPQEQEDIKVVLKKYIEMHKGYDPEWDAEWVKDVI